MSEKFIDREYLLDSFKDYNTYIVEKKFDQVNSNLSQLEFGEVAGGKNLATVTIPSISNNNIIFTKKDDSTLIANGSNYNA